MWLGALWEVMIQPHLFWQEFLIGFISCLWSDLVAELSRDYGDHKIMVGFTRIVHMYNFHYCWIIKFYSILSLFSLWSPVKIPVCTFLHVSTVCVCVCVRVLILSQIDTGSKWPNRNRLFLDVNSLLSKRIIQIAVEIFECFKCRNCLL